jgi:hypothetical protein
LKTKDVLLSLLFVGFLIIIAYVAGMSKGESRSNQNSSIQKDYNIVDTTTIITPEPSPLYSSVDYPESTSIYQYTRLEIEQTINYSSLGLPPNENDGLKSIVVYVSDIKQYKGKTALLNEFTIKFKDETKKAFKKQMKFSPVDYKIVSINAPKFYSYEDASEAWGKEHASEIEFPIYIHTDQYN